jgi:hypothetical protein
MSLNSESAINPGLPKYSKPVQDRYEPLAVVCGRSAETGVYMESMRISSTAQAQMAVAQ